MKRDALGEAAVATREVGCGDGEVLLRVDRFALTANNVTYAAHGVDMRYWDFFPASEGFGIVPVWGFADVVESRVESVAVGARVYGYWPMASHALVTPARASPRGFIDAAAHRAGLAPVYNGYEFASPAWGDETLQCLFRPLYITSYVLDLMLQDSPVETLVLTSASSKTALGLAQLAKGRQLVVGLTSPANRAFVEATGYYDVVLDYGDVAGLAALPGTCSLVDFSGNGSVRHDVHATLGERLVESHIVGDTHWDAANLSTLPGVRPKPFFAPSVIVARVAEWGNDGFQARLTTALAAFVASTGWLRIEAIAGADAVVAAWAGLAAGRIDPALGMVARV
ncbi:hypothetical protein IP88_14335 [alpha proteobacterium AAP81b]|nr:hypothetical protein IP88_14335 [alpha proteobacterium AAP81b]